MRACTRVCPAYLHVTATALEVMITTILVRVADAPTDEKRSSDPTVRFAASCCMQTETGKQGKLNSRTSSVDK
eukprot:scaffold274616_cov21-Tisochrysis_lutea.AAC.1